MIQEGKIKKFAKKKLTDYLVLNRYRKTLERYALLDIIYDEPKHFYIEDLQIAMQEKKIQVSRATIYNTIQLFLKCNLIIKHQLCRNTPFYERSHGNDFHYYLICNLCHTVEKMKDAPLKLFLKNREFKKFRPVHYCFYVYGLCDDCFRRNRIKQLKNKRR